MGPSSAQVITARVASMQYGWWVGIASGITMALSAGPLMQGASALFSAIEDDFGWSRTQVSAAASIGQLALALLSPFVGAVTDRVGPGPVILGGLALTGIGSILLSLVNSPLAYYGAFLIIFTGFAFGGFMPCMTAVNRWLPQRRAAGMSLVMAGGSAGAVLVPAVAWGITQFGWRPTVVALGIILIAAAPFLSKIIGRPVPRAAAPTPDGAQAAGETGFTAKEALRTWAFYALALAHMLSNLAVAAVAAHVILHLRDVGMSLGMASLVLPVVGVTEFAGRLAGGFLGDTLNRRIALFAVMSVQAVSMLVLAYATTFWMASIFAVLWGIGFGARGPIFHALRADYFGARAYATILGISSVSLSVGMMASPVTVGWLFDQQGTYEWAFLGLAGTSMLAALIIATAARPARQEHRGTD